MMDVLTPRLVLVVALGSLVPAFQPACASEGTIGSNRLAREAKILAPKRAGNPLKTAAASTKAAASDSSSTSPSSRIGQPPTKPTDPFGDIVAQVNDILTKNSVTQKPLKALLGEITYQNTDFSSPLSMSIKEWLRQEFDQHDEIILLEPPRLRGIEVVEKPQTTAALAEIVGADVWLTGEYRKTDDGIDLRVPVRKRPGGQLLGIARTVLPARLIPVGMNTIPENLDGAQANQALEEKIAPLSSAQQEAAIRIEVWTDRGKGALYVEGDELLVLVRTNRDAYVRLYYTDATNQTYQIFPNRYHPEGKIPGNVVIRIPDPQDAFTFRVKAPFGVESITALASPKPFVDLDIATMNAGPFQKLTDGLRGLDVVSSTAQKNEIVRDRFVLTTIPLVGTTDPSWD
jgi:hypothetical protein